MWLKKFEISKDYLKIDNLIQTEIYFTGERWEYYAKKKEAKQKQKQKTRNEKVLKKRN